MSFLSRMSRSTEHKHQVMPFASECFVAAVRPQTMLQPYSPLYAMYIVSRLHMPPHFMHMWLHTYCWHFMKQQACLILGGQLLEVTAVCTVKHQANHRTGVFAMQVNLFIAVLKIKFAKAQTLFHSKLAKLSRKKRKNMLARVMEKSKNRIKDQVKKRREASEVSMVLLYSGLRTVPPCLQQMAGEAVADLHGFPRLKCRYGRVCHQEPHGGQTPPMCNKE